MNFLDSAIEASPDAVVICDDRGRVCAWNTVAESLFGYSRSEALGRCVNDLVLAPEIHTRYRQLLSGLVDGDSTVPTGGQQRIMVVTRSGDQVPVELWYRAVRERGEFRVIGYFRNQRHLDHLESRLAQTNLEARLLDQSELFSCDEESLEAALRMSLDALCDVTGWPLGHALLPDSEEQTLMATHVWSTTDPAAFAGLIKGGSQRRFSAGEDLVGQVWQSGTAAWQLLNANSHYADEAQELLTAGVVSRYCVPIKIRRRVIAVLEFFCPNSEPPEESLMRLVRRLSRSLGHVIERREWEVERQRMAAVVETSFDAIISKSPEGTIISWNSGAERLYGYTAEEAIGQHVRLILPETMAREESELLEAAAQGRRMEQFDTVRRRKSGELIAISLTTSPLRNSSGRVIGSSTIERDVTRRREAQHRLEDAIQTAEEASRAKSEFLANISHELRTPMNVILGMTELSLHEELPEIVRDYLVTVKDSADTMLFLINDILDFSRLEADRFELDPVPFDIRRMLDETMRALSLRAHEKGLELAARVDPDVPFRLLGDPMRLRQMLTNLVGNAIKFTQTGEVVVSLKPVDGSATDSAAWNVGDPIQLHFCVVDTGIGISEADQRRIFAPFTQADASITRLYAGTGLGLSICHELATLQNGRIWVDSQEGVGSRFHFTVCMEVAPASEESESPVQIQRGKLAGTRVLVVDDNKTNRHIIREMLESWSMRPSVADSAESAIRELHAAAEVGEGFPLLIVDAVMPQTDGIELLEKIEATTESVGATILMISPADQHLFRQRSDGLPIHAFLEKPVSQSSLLNSIREAVGDVAIVRSLDQPIQPAIQPLSILVAEDIPANQKVVTAILRRRGHEVTIAHNGREAIDLYERGCFDVALMDVQMPILDGLQATKAIRRLESGTDRHIPIVAMTAHAMRGDRQACLDVGMDGYVSKPLDAELLLRTVEQLSPSKLTDSELHESLFTKSGMWRVRRPAGPEAMSGTPVENNNQTNAQEVPGGNFDASPVESETVWKPQVAMRRMGGDADLLESMIGYFLEDAPDLLQQLDALIQTGNAGESTRVAHSLKGLCSSFEAAEPTQVALNVETACRNQDFREAAELKPVLEKQVNRLTRSLTQWKASQRR